MTWLGDFRLGETFDLKFTTRQISGAPFTLAGTPVISAYPGNSTTQLTAGITLSVDFDSVTGLNNVRVVATSGNGYATATNYALVITTGTVNSVSVVGEVVGHFSIENRSALMPTTAARTLDVSAGGEAGVDWANVGSPTTAVNLSATNIDVDQVVASVSGTCATVTNLTNLPTIPANWLTAAGTAADFTTEIQSGLATAAALTTAQTDISAILVDTAEIGVAGAGLTNINLPNQTMDIVGNITGNLSGSVGSVTGLTAANLDTTVSSRASAADLATVAGYLDTEIAAIKAKTDNLPAAPAAVGDIPTSAQNADAVWDEAIAGHLGAGSTGEALNAAGAAGDPWTTTLPGAYGAGSAGFIIGTNIDAPISTVDTVVDAIKAKTDSLTFTVANVVDSNIQRINDVVIVGDGSGTPFNV